MPAYGEIDSKPHYFGAPHVVGGPHDGFARLLAEGMSRELGCHIIVENKGEANGIIGALHVANVRLFRLLMVNGSFDVSFITVSYYTGF